MTVREPQEDNKNMLASLLTCLEILLAFIFWGIHIAIRGIPLLIIWAAYEYVQYRKTHNLNEQSR